MPETNSKPRGGARPNSGRKKGSSVYGESTKAVRVPESLLSTVMILLESRKQTFGRFTDNSTDIFYPTAAPSFLALPLFAGKVSAGFPSPADDYIEKTLDLNELLVQQPAATFFVRAQGESMLGAGIHPNDILVVDRSLEAVSGKIVICALDGELTVKRLIRENDHWTLQAENLNYADIVIYDGLELVIWGVVTNVIHAL